MYFTKTASATNLSLEGGTQLRLPFLWSCILPKDDTFPFPVVTKKHTRAYSNKA